VFKKNHLSLLIGTVIVSILIFANIVLPLFANGNDRLSASQYSTPYGTVYVK